MNNNLFNRRLDSEIVRHIETVSELENLKAIESTLQREEAPLENKLHDRAKRLIQEHHLANRIDLLKSKVSSVTFGMAMLALVLGCLASQHAFAQLQPGAVNFYWLALVLLGTNLIALLVWLLGWLFSFRSLIMPSGLSLGQRVIKGLTGLFSHDKVDGAILSGLFQVTGGGRIGRWNLSRLTHGLWLSYLLGGLVMILIMLSTRQYDFVWETTILSEEAFIRTTQLMGTVPSMLGFDIPRLDLIEMSRLGGQSKESALSDASAESLRQAWASLLIGSLLVYGVLPRVLLCLISHLMLLRANAAYQLDLTQPYYVRLRQRLVPVTRQLGIVDPDTKGTPGSADRVLTKTDEAMPAEGYYLGLELNLDQPWPPSGVSDDKNLGQVCDRDEQNRALAKLTELSKQPNYSHSNTSVIIVVPLQRSPDRGMESYLKKVVGAVKCQILLALSEAAQNKINDDFVSGNISTPKSVAEDATLRLADWHQLAARLDITHESVVHMQYLPVTRSADHSSGISSNKSDQASSRVNHG